MSVELLIQCFFLVHRIDSFLLPSGLFSLDRLFTFELTTDHTLSFDLVPFEGFGEQQFTIVEVLNPGLCDHYHFLEILNFLLF